MKVWSRKEVLFGLQTIYSPSSGKPWGTREAGTEVKAMEGCCWELKRARSGEEGEGEDQHSARVPPILWSVRRGRTAVYLPLIPGWASEPLTHSSGGWQGGSPTWESRIALLKPPGLWERGSQH